MNLNRMERIAKRSTHRRYQHCSLIFAGNRFLVYGYNHGEIHAEVMAIRRLKALLRNENSRKPRNLHMVNFMIKRKTGKPGNSIPCDHCYTRAILAGINIITCFSENHWIQLGGI